MDNWGDILERLRLGDSGDGWEEGWTGAEWLDSAYDDLGLAVHQPEPALQERILQAAGKVGRTGAAAFCGGMRAGTRLLLTLMDSGEPRF